jgi:MFS family permease
MAAALARTVDAYRQALIGAHRNIRLYFIGAFLTQVSAGFSSILYNLYIKSLGLPDTVAGSYIAASSIANTLFLVPAGMLSDGIGRKRAIVGAGFLTAGLAALQAFLQAPTLIVIGAFLSGMVASVIWVSVLPMLAENTRPEERMHLFSLEFALTLSAQVLGSLGGGGLSDLLQALGMEPVWAIRLTLLLGAALAAGAMIPFLRIREVRRGAGVPAGYEKEKPAQHAEHSGWRGGWRRFAGRREQLRLIIKFMTASALIGFGAGLVIPYLNLYFSDRFHMSKAAIGLVVGISQAVTAIAMFVGPALARRFGPVRAVVLLQLASIPFLLFTGWAMNVWLASAAVVVRQALMNSSNPIQDSIMMALVDDDLKGFAVSCGQTMFTLGWAVMGPVSTSIVHRYGSYTGYALVFTGTAVLYLLGSIFYGIAFGRYQARVMAVSDGVSI